MRTHTCQGDNDAGKIDLGKYVDVIAKSPGCCAKAVIEEIPQYNATDIEKHRRDIARGYLDQPAENKNIGDQGQHRLEKYPARAQDGLLVIQQKLFPDQAPEEMAVRDQAFNIPTPVGCPGRDLPVPVFFQGLLL